MLDYGIVCGIMQPYLIASKLSDTFIEYRIGRLPTSARTAGAMRNFCSDNVKDRPAYSSSHTNAGHSLETSCASVIVSKLTTSRLMSPQLGVEVQGWAPPSTGSESRNCDVWTGDLVTQTQYPGHARIQDKNIRLHIGGTDLSVYDRCWRLECVIPLPIGSPILCAMLCNV